MAAFELAIEGLLGRLSARARAESPRACTLLTALNGKRLALQISGTPWAQRPILIESSGEALRLTSAAAANGTAAANSAAADATLIGAPLSLLLLATADPEAPIRRGDVRIEGDTHIAEQFRELALLLRPDLEDSLAHLVGRSAAHLAMRGVRQTAAWVRASAWNSVRNLAEYLAHESGELVSRHEAEHFLLGADELRERLDRLEARLSHLQRRAAALGGGVGPAE